MRRASAAHGTVGRVTSGGGNTESSSAVMRGWSWGRSVKVTIQSSTQAKLSPAQAKKAMRQPALAITATITMGALALPMRAAAWVMPWAKPRLPLATQRAIAAVEAGKVAPSPRPSSKPRGQKRDQGRWQVLTARWPPPRSGRKQSGWDGCRNDR